MRYSFRNYSETDTGYRVLIEQSEVIQLVNKFPDFLEIRGSLLYENVGAEALHIFCHMGFTSTTFHWKLNGFLLCRPRLVTENQITMMSNSPVNVVSRKSTFLIRALIACNHVHCFIKRKLLDCNHD
jgi:hypothetical protein